MKIEDDDRRYDNDDQRCDEDMMKIVSIKNIIFSIKKHLLMGLKMEINAYHYKIISGQNYREYDGASISGHIKDSRGRTAAFSIYKWTYQGYKYKKCFRTVEKSKETKAYEKEKKIFLFKKPWPHAKRGYILR